MSTLEASEPISLRGHHWICLRYFRGEGYSREFVENLTALIERLATEPAVVTEGPDSVCSVCPHLSDGVCVGNSGESEIRRMDALALELLGYRPGERRDFTDQPDDSGMLARWRAEACVGCVWEQACG
jgi:hypothetical protein